MGRTLADLGAAQSRLQGLDDDFYVRGVLAAGRYRSIRVKLERQKSRFRRCNHGVHYLSSRALSINAVTGERACPCRNGIDDRVPQLS